MIAELKPYPACKDSGVPWLGEVPEHWEIRTLRRILRSYNGIKIGPFGSQLKLEHMSPSGYKVYGQANVIASDFARGIKFIDQKKYAELSSCELRPNDLVMTMMGTGGRCARVPNNATPGIMDSHLLRLRTDATIYTPFAALILDQAPYVKEQINMASKGSIMQGLNSSIVKDIVLSLPPLLEQAAIVRFLDHIDRRIRRYISAKQKLIKLLEEQKQAIIHRAVTRGLDPNVRLKPSGVEWLGDVPEHWEVRRIRNVVDMRVSNVDKHTKEGELPVQLCNYVDVYKNDRISERVTFMRATALWEEIERFRLEPGDVLITKDSEAWNDIGVPALVEYSAEDLICGYHLALLRPRKALLSGPYLLRTLQSPAVTYQFHVAANGVTRYGLSHDSIKSVLLPIPPLTEQAAIVRFLDEATANITSAKDHAHREISLLREYRTRLIADVVTGNVDVREAAERLPDEAAETEFVDDTAAMAEGGEDGEDQVVDPPPEEDANGLCRPY